MENTQEHFELMLTLFQRLEKKFEKYDSISEERTGLYRDMQLAYNTIRCFNETLIAIANEDEFQFENSRFIAGEVTARLDYFDRYGKDFGTDD